MIDDMAVFAISMVTLEATGITNKYNKLCTLKDTVGWYGGKPDESPHFSNWEWYREKYHIRYWIYQSEVLPNE